jgi:hypothetical protein
MCLVMKKLRYFPTNTIKITNKRKDIYGKEMCSRQYFVISGKEIFPVYFIEIVLGINDD